MATADLHGLLKSLCFGTHWKYAVFWKLKHRARLVLTWEDGYYDNCDSSSMETLENSPGGGRYSHDPLGLALAKMSYHVYSLGEGIVGQVAVTGKHQWILADQDVTNSCSSFEFSDGWQSQYSAGIRTIVVVAVVPLGVVQLGSMNKVIEDMKLVTHVRDVFFTLKDFSVGHGSSPMPCSIKSTSLLPDLPSNTLASECFPNCSQNLDNIVYREGPNVQLPIFLHDSKHSASSYVYPVSGVQPNMVVAAVNKHKGFQFSMPCSDKNVKLLQPRLNVVNLQHQNQLGMDLIVDGMSEGETSGWKDFGLISEHNGTPFSINSVMDSMNVCSVELQPEKLTVDHAYFPANLLDSTLCDRIKLERQDSYQNRVLSFPESSDMKSQTDLAKLGNQLKLNQLDPSDTSLKFSAVSELHEALGPAFLKKRIYNDNEEEDMEATKTIEMPEVMNSSHLTIDSTKTIEMPEVMNSSHLTIDSNAENLLEAVVANACQSSSDAKSDRSFCKSVQSLLTTEKIPESSSQTKHTSNSVGHSISQSSFVEDKQHCLNSSGVCSAVSSKGFSSTCPSTCSEQLDRSSEPAKNNKKRAKPGENCRPRPRDRQLIQDRIKELRELVPNGSKCSIDSLLERTIKHMLFLQSITKHADKLSKCAESKMHQKGTSIQGCSNYEQGSSWAVEVGSHLKVCSIIVENLNKSGQMLVEMMCEECSHFLEIAEVIRSLGLTILKGVTEAHGDKTWICFVVEGQDNRIMHRMDVLWSLVQILQSKSACS